MLVRVASIALAAAAAAATAAPASAAVFARAEIVPANPAFDVLSTNKISTPDFAFADLVTTIGFAEADIRSSTGTLAGLARVSLSNSAQRRGGSLTAFGGGTLAEAMTVSDEYCSALGCLRASDLGITRIAYTVRIRASGGVATFNNDTKGSANSQSRVTYDWSIGGASGGGDKLSVSNGDTVGEIKSASPTFLVAPGAQLLLQMGFNVSASAGIAPPNEQNSSPAGSALADFAHTLQWGGVLGAQAFGSDGREIALAPDGRFSLIGANGFDYWDAAPGIAAAVPEPASWAMMIAGFGMAGAAARAARRRAAKMVAVA